MNESIIQQAVNQEHGAATCRCGSGLAVADDGQCIACWLDEHHVSEPLPRSSFYDLDLATQDRLTKRQQVGMAGEYR